MSEARTSIKENVEAPGCANVAKRQKSRYPEWIDISQKYFLRLHSCTLILMVTASQTCRWGSFGDSLAVISEPCLFYSIQAIPLLPTNATNAAMPPKKKKKTFCHSTRTSHESINRLPVSSELSTKDLEAPLGIRPFCFNGRLGVKRLFEPARPSCLQEAHPG